MADVDPRTVWYHQNLDVFLNRWFSNFEEARKSLNDQGGFLLPYKKHYFVCESDVIEAMGLEPDDPDRERIGRDCARPGDLEAYQRLYEKREQIVRANSD